MAVFNDISGSHGTIEKGIRFKSFFVDIVVDVLFGTDYCLGQLSRAIVSTPSVDAAFFAPRVEVGLACPIACTFGVAFESTNARPATSIWFGRT